MKFSIIDPHSEAFARRSVVIMYNLLTQGCITDEQVLMKILPLIESRVIKFLNIRYHEDEALALATNMTEKLPLKPSVNHVSLKKVVLFY